MHIIITRPIEDSIYIINRLKKKGHIVTHIPVIKIQKIETKKINLKNYSTVIFTSSNAIKFLNIEKINPTIKCFCVGEKTELIARQAGFLNTYSSSGTVDSLIELIIRMSDTKSGQMLYLSSEFISKNLDHKLIDCGFSVDRISNYTSIPVEEIDEKTLSFLKKNKPDAIFVYSLISANNLINLINKYALLNLVTQCNLMCISEKVLLLLSKIKWKKTLIFNPGDEDFILNKL